MELDAETKTLLEDRPSSGVRYGSPEARRRAKQLSSIISFWSREVRNAAAAGDQARRDEAIPKLTGSVLERRALREPANRESRPEALEEETQPQVGCAPAPATLATDMDKAQAGRGSGALQAEHQFEVIDTNQGHRIAEHLENIARSMRSDLGEFDGEVRIRRLPRRNGRVAS